MTINALELARALIRCPSVTPTDAGALAVLEGALAPLGFACRRMPYAESGTPDVDNLYARIGVRAPNFCFAGHTDVVPVGDAKGWTVDPFAAVVKEGRLYGRGASDMKGAIAAFVAAAARLLAETNGTRASGARGASSENFPGSISLMITGDEEGPSINGTAKVLKTLAAEGEKIDACLVGEPTSPKTFGEMAKIGRRGSLNASLGVHGVQGHSAYPEATDNPIPRLLKMLAAIAEVPLDPGSGHFQPSTVAITSIDVGNPATNVTPARASAKFNVRFNDRHSGESLKKLLRERCEKVGGKFELTMHVTGEPFVVPPGPLSRLVVEAVREVVGAAPELSTHGGTSDARVIRHYCPVIEFGGVNATSHKVDEWMALEDIARLAEIYYLVLKRFFAVR
jgi:succinyl-diaminopimelate desuccinylase